MPEWVFGMAYRDPEARRAYERRYYAEHRDKILARRRTRRATRTPEQRRRDSERRKRRPQPRRAELAPERLELIRARDRARKRPMSEARRAAAREATRRWYTRNKVRLRPDRRAKDRERYADNRGSVLSAKRIRYATDRVFAETIRTTNRGSYQRNRERWRDSRRRYYAEHVEELRARQRQRNRQKYAADPRAWLDYYKRWRERNLERARAYVRVAGHKRRVASAGTHFTFAEWAALLERYEGRCAYCGSTERIEADHRIPLCRGGSNDIGNILPACRSCNRRKHRKTEAEFRGLVGREATSRG